MQPMRHHASASTFDWDFVTDMVWDHGCMFILLGIVLFLLWKEYTIYWAPHGW